MTRKKEHERRKRHERKITLDDCNVAMEMYNTNRLEHTHTNRDSNKTNLCEKKPAEY